MRRSEEDRRTELVLDTMMKQLKQTHDLDGDLAK